MNFFQRQRDVRKLSRRLVALFIVAVIGIVLTVDLVALLLFGYANQPIETTLNAIIVISLLLIVAIGLTSLIRTKILKGGGGGKVAQQLGGLYVPENTTDPRLQRLRNVVEEMAIASGVPVPEVYVLPHENGINAFAAGYSPADAAIAVTHGTLERLNRDELQGVIAHEFSHVINGDMRLNIRLMGVLFGILVLAIIGRVLIHIRGGNRNPLPIVGLVMIIVGYAGVFAGRLIKAAVSRQREYLADASAVQYTRQSAGIAGALKKIGGLTEGSKLGNDRAEDVSHMLFGEGRKFSNLFATHPPIDKRIQTLDPTFDPRQLEQLSRRWASAPPSGMAEDQAMGLAGPGQGAPPPGPAQPPQGMPQQPGQPGLPTANAAFAMRPEHVAGAIGSSATPDSAAHRRAGSILDGIPRQFLDRARDPDAVLPLVFGLLMSRDQRIRTAQHGAIASRYGNTLADAVWHESDALAQLHPVLRIPLAELAFPVLRRRPRPAQEAVLACINALIQADGRVDVFEYGLSRLLHRELHEAMHQTPPWPVRRHTLAQSRLAVAALLAILAQVGHSDPAAAAAAYTAGVRHVLPDAPVDYAPPERGVMALEGAWPLLDGLNGDDKTALVTSMVTVISHDGVMTVSEIELLRTVCALLHCPLPPLAEVAPTEVTPDTTTHH